MSDSEAETVIMPKEVLAPTKEKKGRQAKSSSGSAGTSSAGTKRKSDTTQRGRKKSRVADIFGLCDSDFEELVVPPTSNKKKLPSSFVNRVATGNQRRVADTNGEYYVELKVYNKEEAQLLAPEDRWKKAFVRIQFATDDDSKQWECVQKLVREAHKLFLHNSPTFYSNTTNFK